MISLGDQSQAIAPPKANKSTTAGHGEPLKVVETVTTMEKRQESLQPSTSKSAKGKETVFECLADEERGAEEPDFETDDQSESDPGNSSI